MTGCMIGWAHMPFGKHVDDDYESMIVRVARDALQDAGVPAKDVDEIFVGLLNAGMCKQEFPGALVLQADDDLRYKPATRVENACATGTAAIYQGLNAIAAGKARIVLVVGVEKMTHVPGPEMGAILTKGSYVKEEAETYDSFAGVFGHIANLYFQRHGDQSQALARIAAKNHKNGTANPLAHMQKELSYEFCLAPSEKNPFVAPPLKRTDCSLVTDGAAAVVLADVETAMAMKKAVVFRAAQHVTDFFPMSRRDMTFFDGAARAWQQAFDEAGVTVDDLDVVETHDCFTIAELMQYEAMGLTEPGQGYRAIEEGWTAKDGRLPVNASGGLKSKGHPIGATGVSM
ncbi:MAG: acetyl-CoA acetyltransferase, partial [Proteobacteria bacterium]|nr:acetyl-CoA acetyltransferase [Pseudomonadota bacterium]